MSYTAQPFPPKRKSLGARSERSVARSDSCMSIHTVKLATDVENPLSEMQDINSLRHAALVNIIDDMSDEDLIELLHVGASHCRFWPLQLSTLAPIASALRDFVSARTRQNEVAANPARRRPSLPTSSSHLPLANMRGRVCLRKSHEVVDASSLRLGVPECSGRSASSRSNSRRGRGRSTKRNRKK